MELSIICMYIYIICPEYIYIFTLMSWFDFWTPKSLVLNKFYI